MSARFHAAAEAQRTLDGEPFELALDAEQVELPSTDLLRRFEPGRRGVTLNGERLVDPTLIVVAWTDGADVWRMEGSYTPSGPYEPEWGTFEGETRYLGPLARLFENLAALGATR